MLNTFAARLFGRVFAVLFIVSMAGCSGGPPKDLAHSLTPPEAPREFRAAWVATVANIDWPTRPGLSSEEQQKEILAILDEVQRLKMNAVVLQVRTSCDSFYPSPLEPWSQYLTGTQGKAPDPFYDPLQMWIEEAHKRGLELHAWFNPYRARAGGAKGETSPSHISKTNPAIVKSFNGYEWLDPAEPAAQDLTYNVFLDVVRRYDVDGIHIDDYFYPYPDYLTNKETKEVSDFPDNPSWTKYVESGGKLSRSDWRRDSVNRLIERVYKGIKATKPHVQFGISPFGIASPGKPATVKSSFNQYENLYADAKLWLNKGWCDYYTPQLYWKVGSEQPYEDLIKWWANENTQGRHLWPGISTSRVGNGPKSYEPQDIVNQIYVTRDTPGATGNVQFSMKAIQRNYGQAGGDAEPESRRDRRRREADSQPTTGPTTSPATAPSVPEKAGIATVLADGPYADAALVPATPWLDAKAPDAPNFQVAADKNDPSVNVSWQPRGKEAARVWAVYTRHGASWKLQVFPAHVREAKLQPDTILGPVTAVCVRAVDRLGNESKAVEAKEPKRKK